MNRLPCHSAMFCVSLCLLANPNAIAPAADANTSAPLLLIVEKNAPVPDDVLQIAEKHVERIYQKAGIDIIWQIRNRDSPEKESLPEALPLTIVIAPDCVSPQTCQDLEATGLAMGSNGKGARRAYVFWKRVVAEATILRNTIPLPYPEALMLGIALAHESGHVLLPSGHSRSGIMAARMDASAVQAAIRGKLLFLPEQAQRIRQVIADH